MGLVIDYIKGILFHNHKWKDILPYGIFPGDFIVAGNLTIRGNLIQERINEVETVLIADNTILLNNGEQGSGVTKRYSGLEVDRGSLNKAYLLFDESDDNWHFGFENGSDFIVEDKNHKHNNFTKHTANFVGCSNLIPVGTNVSFVSSASGIIEWSVFTLNNQNATCSFIVKKNGVDMIGSGTKPSLNNAKQNSGNSSNWSSNSFSEGDYITVEVFSNTNATDVAVLLKIKYQI